MIKKTKFPLNNIIVSIILYNLAVRELVKGQVVLLHNNISMYICGNALQSIVSQTEW